MTNNPNSISSIESSANTRKSSKFVENTKRAVRKVLATTWIVAGSMLPINTSTALPVSANKIISIEPTTSTTIKTVWQWTTADLLTAFNEKDNEVSNQETSENNNIEEAKQSETDVTRWEIWTTADTEANNSTINSLGYNAIEITNINPVDILPIIWQVEAWDKQCYEHIKHLRVAEATRIRDMMREYGAGNYSAEEYKQLMNRLNTGMTQELPSWYDNYEIIWEWTLWWNWTEHAHAERSILCALINHANLKLVNESIEKSRQSNLMDFIQNNPNSINIFWCSSYTEAYNKTDYDIRLNEQSIKDLCNSKKFIMFAAGTNIETVKWYLKNRIYNGDYETNEHWMYSLASLSNSDKNTQPNSHLLVTIATNKDGNIDQTNVTRESSKYPVWFKDNVLFSWRGFPQEREDAIYWPSWRYTTSDTNYFNVALASILFQLKADTPDVDQLLEMIRSTALTDHIKLDLNGDGDTNDNYQGQTENQPLLLINPAWFFQKYLMPTNLPTSIKTDENITLEKGFYHGVIFQIPGAEVNINGQWIPFTDDNKDLIFSQNPMNLEWRVNGKSLNNYNYKPGDTINGQIIAVDDQWNGLNITKDFSINVEDASGIDSVTMNHVPNTWYSIDGIRLNEKPTKPGIYVVNGHKVFIK